MATPAKSDAKQECTIEVLIDDETAYVNLDEIIDRLMEARNSTTVQLPEMEVIALCRKFKEVVQFQSTLLELHSPITIVGDTHGHFPEVVRWFDICGYPPVTSYLFLGSYINRGKFSLETMLLLMCYEIKHPDTFFMLRGNHETSALAKVHGFYDDCRKRYNLRLSKVFLDLFNYLPIAAVIDSRIFCVHGGLSPDLHNLDQIRKLHRPLEVSDQGLVCDLLWADLNKADTGWGTNQRGISFAYGSEIVTRFLTKHELDLICRSHEVVEDGYEFFAKRQLVTLFSVPNYCGEYDNAGAVMSVSDTLQCNFRIVKSKAPVAGKPRSVITDASPLQLNKTVSVENNR